MLSISSIEKILTVILTIAQAVLDVVSKYAPDAAEVTK